MATTTGKGSTAAKNGRKKTSAGRTGTGSSAKRKTSRTTAGRNTSRKAVKSASSKRAVRPATREYVDYALYFEIIIWIVLGVCIFLFLGMLGYCGRLGRACAGFCFGLFGIIAYAFPFFAFFLTSFLISNFNSFIAKVKAASAFGIFLTLCGFAQMLLVGYNRGYHLTEYYQAGAAYKTGGGFAGGALVSFFCPGIGTVGTWLVLFLMLIIFLILLTQRSVFAGVKRRGIGMVKGARVKRSLRLEWMQKRRQQREEALRKEQEEGAEPDPDTLYGTDPADDFSILPKSAGTRRRTRKYSGVTSSTSLTPEGMIKKEGTEENEKGEANTPEEQRQTPGSDVKVAGAFMAGDGRDTSGVHDLKEDPGNPDVNYEDLDDIRTGHAGAKQAARPVKERLKSAFDTLFHDEKEEPKKRKESAAQSDPDERQGRGETRLEERRPKRHAQAKKPQKESGYGEISDREMDRINAAADRLIEKTGGKTGANAAAQPAGSTVPEKTSRRRTQMDAGEKEAGIRDVANEIARQTETEASPAYVFPPLSLLKKPSPVSGGNTEEELRETAARLQQVLKTFGVNVKVTNVTCGPSVTRYEMIPEMGVKVSRIVSLQDDIKLNLAVTDIRIEAPIPGKSAVGIEVPNKKPTPVLLRDVLESDAFRTHKSSLAYAVGKDIAGKTIVSDIAKMPHLLIAGSTGSGKSVFINTLIMSIIYKSKPEDVKLIMIDPKVVELSVYNGIPHLFIPVVTDAKKAAGALNWAVAEMMKRYQKFAEAQVRDLKGYNQKVAQIAENTEGAPEKMPQIVVIVDELADLMMVASSEVEDAIVRLTQLARAAGIHLVIATQRPSVDVITGLIKANMPSRIAFAVSSGVDARTILDQTGAEKLLGNGDMLFYPSNYKQPLRVQGAFISDQEVADVVNFLKEHGSGESGEAMAERIASVEKAAASSSAGGGGSDRDDLFEQAAKFIIEKDKASIGMLQRWFKIGFNRAARIMDQLSDASIVGPEEGTKPRKVLMSMEQLEEYLEEN